MTSHKRLFAAGLTLLVWTLPAGAEGSFFKDRREAAVQAKVSPTAARATSAATPATASPSPSASASASASAAPSIAPEVEQQQAPTPEASSSPPREQAAAPAVEPAHQSPPPEQHNSGSAQTQAPPAEIAGPVSEVPSTDTLVVAGQRVQLAGVRGVSEMTQPLQRWIASTGNTVTCRPAGTRYRCTTANGSDVGQVVLQNGGGTAEPGAPANYRGAEMQARMARRGIWRQR